MAHRTSSPTCKTRTSPTTPRPTPASPPSRTNPTVATSPSTPSAATAVTPSATRTPSPSTPSARMSSPPSSPPTPHFLFLYSLFNLVQFLMGCERLLDISCERLLDINNLAFLMNCKKIYGIGGNLPVDTFRRYSRDSVGDEDSFAFYSVGKNVVTTIFTSYSTLSISILSRLLH
ncbi:uncharacterized protein A4U43_C03F18700 [Asparagus officinalis]|uniref:Uncharacterized protein n=1 Tax=Asparagus officinalis TaxID=4686 RepID=A0A5P1FGB8_ASPOF|nr:uncharacterized protein A4U43_C03F18700 [Asparagus officinalis]